MRYSSVRFLTAALLAALLAVGCGGGGTDVKQTTNTTTMGQELMDLNSSYEKGIIDEDEYKKAKKQIMKRYN